MEERKKDSWSLAKNPRKGTDKMPHLIKKGEIGGERGKGGVLQSWTSIGTNKKTVGRLKRFFGELFWEKKKKVRKTKY